MDPHALSQGRTMLLVRGGIAFLVGVIISNQPGASADALMTLFGIWALLEGAATIRQAYARVDQSDKIAARPVLLVLGGVAVVAGVLAILGLGLSTNALTWVLAAWIIVRVAFEVWCAYVAPITRIRVLFALVGDRRRRPGRVPGDPHQRQRQRPGPGRRRHRRPVGCDHAWSSGWPQSKVDLVTAAGPRMLQNH